MNYQQMNEQLKQSLDSMKDLDTRCERRQRTTDRTTIPIHCNSCPRRASYVDPTKGGGYLTAVRSASDYQPLTTPAIFRVRAFAIVNFIFLEFLNRLLRL